MAFVIGIQWRLLFTNIFCRHLVLGFVGVQWRLLAFGGIFWRAMAFVVYQYFWETFVIGDCWHSVAFVGVRWGLLAFGGVWWRLLAFVF